MEVQQYEKEGCIYYVQTDHLTGEEVGIAIEALYQANASNVHVVQTITKKNRPGCLFLIDVRPQYREQVERAIVLDLRVSGWHFISTRHHHLKVDYLKRQAHFICRGQEFDLDLELKKSYGCEITLRPEMRTCRKLKETLLALGEQASVRRCEEIIREIYREDLQEYRISQE